MPPPTVEEILEVETGLRLLMIEKPGEVASKRSAVVVIWDIQV